MRGVLRLPQLAVRAVRWRTGHWLPSHLLHHRPFDLRRFDNGQRIDVIVVIVDHFEPQSRNGPSSAADAVANWCHAYEQIASRFRDADGRPPQHTWFYPAECPDRACVQALSASVSRGYGEIEFHLHHGHDTHETFSEKLRAGLDWLNESGAMVTASPRPERRFAYIAGNWALDNGVGNDAFSGCNTELIALREAGCYADFTFPALGVASQPRKTNSIYYATDDPRPKSYDSGVDVAVGRPPSGDLMLFQGPLVLDWETGRIEDGGLELGSPPSPSRLACWLRAHVHVKGRPEWVFVKLHTHAIQSRDAFLGPGLPAMFQAMQDEWNRPPFRLHFATAREAYNMVKSAEAGKDGNPNDYRDYVIPPPANRGSKP